MKTFAEEFFRAMGKILMGSPLEQLDLTLVEFEKGLFDDLFSGGDDVQDDPDDGRTFMHVVVSFDPEEGPF